MCGVTLHMLSLVCIARRVDVISTGPISTIHTEVRGPASSYSRMKTPPISFNQCSVGH
ncbi:unnamed protein product [Staurois parvus]|uniref:Uncharacterized protein n=1 Tax=Staurois parvus TaxID=386267 RepID=A0ABN9CG18_9NEOB|nr:unnamed protein product [Staurois parvus]